MTLGYHLVTGGEQVNPRERQTLEHSTGAIIRAYLTTIIAGCILCIPVMTVAYCAGRLIRLVM
jgi:hypothetical protein